VNAATVDKRKGKAVGFSNTSKIAKATKDRLGKEQRYASTCKGLRYRTQESGTVISDNSEDEGDQHGAVIDAEASDNEEMREAPPEPKPSPKPRRVKFIDRFDTETGRNEAYSRLMETLVTLPLKDLVVFRGSLPQILSRRVPFVPKTGGDDYQVQDILNVGSVGELQVLTNCLDAAAAFGLDPSTTLTETELRVMSIQDVAPEVSNVPSMAMYTPKMEVVLNGKTYAQATLDTGAEVNVMSKQLANRAKLPIETKKNLVFQGISPGKVSFVGACKRVAVMVTDSINYVDFLVLDTGTTDLLLGMPYFIETQLSFIYEADGAI
jgi:hypothetical protein